MIELAPIRWYHAEPARLERELLEMAAIAPELVWDPNLAGTTSGGWAGICPLWPFDRARPDGLDRFADGNRFRCEVRCGQAFPMSEPTVVPMEPEPALWVRTSQRWHVKGDGSLCLIQDANDWTGAAPAAALIPKVAGWFLEYLLLTRGYVEAMSLCGIASSDEFDTHFESTDAPDPT